MPSSVAELVDLLELELIEDNLFRGKQPKTELQRVFGGQVAAHALVAASQTVAEQYVVHSLHSYFLRLARQHGHPIFAMTLNFQIPEEGLEHQDVMPDVPAPELCPSLGDIFTERNHDSDEWDREWAALDVRYAGNSRPGGELSAEFEPARARLWIRVNGELPDAPLQHTAAFTYASDMTLLGATLVPHQVFISSPQVQAASLDHTIWFHRPFRADEWWLYDQHSPSASGGRGLTFARVFTRDGRLVASVAQEGLIRLR
jgi:acyl-CoA thioesterase-2